MYRCLYFLFGWRRISPPAALESISRIFLKQMFLKVQLIYIDHVIVFGENEHFRNLALDTFLGRLQVFVVASSLMGCWSLQSVAISSTIAKAPARF
jgi:hypothetical protein